MLVGVVAHGDPVIWMVECEEEITGKLNVRFCFFAFAPIIFLSLLYLDVLLVAMVANHEADATPGT